MIHKFYLLWSLFFFTNFIGITFAQIEFKEHEVYGDKNTLLYTREVFAIDLDGDNDIDILSPNYLTGKVRWYENIGNNIFESHVISDSVAGPESVFAIDIDKDNDIDVLAAFSNGHKLAWYENDGNQQFVEHSVDEEHVKYNDVYACDLNGDGFIDIMSVMKLENILSWYENDGSQSFSRHDVDSNSVYSSWVYAIDMDNDMDLDILSYDKNKKISWYENEDGTNYNKNIIITDISHDYGISSVFPNDVDGDLDIDMIVSEWKADKITWFENDGDLNFSKHVISDSCDNVRDVFAADMDNDGDMDIIYASEDDGRISWFKNDSSQNFVYHKISNLSHANAVYPIDITDDGKIDVVAASSNRIVFYENLGITGIENSNNRRPMQFHLIQNYPNPFNPSTTISYTIPKTEQVELAVYNITGQKVRTLFSGKQTPGTHIDKFDASGLPSGIYVYRLKAGGFVQSKKMLLLR